MGMGPRKKDIDMRDKQGKMVNPTGSSPTKKQTTIAPDGGTQNKQYKQDKGKPYSPNYPQKDKNITPFGGK
jgi:hypothetical protein